MRMITLYNEELRLEFLIISPDYCIPCCLLTALLTDFHQLCFSSRSTTHAELCHHPLHSVHSSGVKSVAHGGPPMLNNLKIGLSLPPPFTGDFYNIHLTIMLNCSHKAPLSSITQWISLWIS